MSMSVAASAVSPIDCGSTDRARCRSRRARARAALETQRRQGVDYRGGFGGNRVRVAAALADDSRDFGRGPFVRVSVASINLFPRNPRQQMRRNGRGAQRSASDQYRDRRISEIALPIRGVVVRADLAPVRRELDAVALRAVGGNHLSRRSSRIVIDRAHAPVADRAHRFINLDRRRKLPGSHWRTTFSSGAGRAPAFPIPGRRPAPDTPNRSGSARHATNAAR